MTIKIKKLKNKVRSLERRLKQLEAAKSVSNKKRAYTIEEHCEMWAYGRNTIYNEIDCGNLKTIKVGRRRLITEEQEEQYRKLKEKQSQKQKA